MEVLPPRAWRWARLRARTPSDTLPPLVSVGPWVSTWCTAEVMGTLLGQGQQLQSWAPCLQISRPGRSQLPHWAPRKSPRAGEVGEPLANSPRGLE